MGRIVRVLCVEQTEFELMEYDIALFARIAYYKVGRVR